MVKEILYHGTITFARILETEDDFAESGAKDSRFDLKIDSYEPFNMTSNDFKNLYIDL